LIDHVPEIVLTLISNRVMLAFK